MSKRRAPVRRRPSRAADVAAPIAIVPSTDADRAATMSTRAAADALARVLDAPLLSRVVPHLAPETLVQIIRRCGLDACGDIVASATPAQLTTVLDLDLWRPARAGGDERFDAHRFGEWLELLAESGTAVAVQTIGAMDEHVVVAGFSQHIRVFDPATFEPTAKTDDEPFDAGASRPGALECELGGYLVRARDAAAWDAVQQVLAALDADHPDCFHAVMRGCRRLSNSAPEVDGLDDLLTEPEQLLHDVASDREHRRSQQGYSAAASARAFLEMARTRRREPERGSRTNPIAAAYFRDVDDASAATERNAAGRLETTHALPADAEVSAACEYVAELVVAAGLAPEPPRALLESGHHQGARETCIQTLMAHVREIDNAAYLARGRELAFLVNTLVAGCSHQSRPFTPHEASEAVIGVCNLGLEQWPARWPEGDAGDLLAAGSRVTPPATFLRDHDLVTAFDVGWALLYEDVCLFVGRQLLASLKDLESLDVHGQDGLRTLVRELTRHCDRGTPWRAREALEVLATLDTPAWTSLLGLLDECPVIPAVLVATLDGRTTAVSATDFEFISTTSQIESICRFMARLPEMLRN